MILAEDVKDITSRHLLSKGQQISRKHIRVLKIWGISEVSVEGDHGEELSSGKESDPEAVAAATRVLEDVFKLVDITHPALKEIFNISVAHRSRRILKDPESIYPHPMSEPSAPRKKSRPGKIDLANKKLPEIPTTIFELNEVLAAPFASAQEIGHIVNKSPSLASILLRIVNSAFYGFPSKIESTTQAVVLIGSKEISNLALGICMMQVFKGIPKEIVDMKQYIRHSVACGLLSRMIAAHLNIQQTEQMFTAGLLHDIGRLVIYKHFPEQALAFLYQAYEKKESLLSAEKTVPGLQHPVTGKALLEKWKLPLPLLDIVRYHHTPSNAGHPVMATIIHVADLMANAMGLGTSGECYIPAFDDLAWQRLGLSTAMMHTIAEQALHSMTSIESFFGA